MYERRLLRAFVVLAAALVAVLGRAFWVQVVAADSIVRRNEAALRGVRTVLPRRGEVLWADGTAAVRNAPRCVVRIDWARFTTERWRCGRCGDGSAAGTPIPGAPPDGRRTTGPERPCRECGAEGPWTRVPPPDRAALAALVGTAPADLDHALAAVKATWDIEKWRSIDLFPDRSVPREAAIRLAERAAQFPGVEVATEPGRECDDEIRGLAGIATLAWREDVVRLAAEDREAKGLHRYTPDEARRLLVGRRGIEALHDDRFRGVPGVSERPPARDGEETHETVIRPVEDGAPLRTTLVRPIQRVANEIVRRDGVSSSTAVVLDLRDGSVAAIASESDDAYFHAIQGLMPGSVFKIVTALATLEAGIDPAATVDCAGEGFIRRGVHYKCEGVHPGIGLAAAFSKSCNCYFMHRAEDAGPRAMADAYERLGLAVTPRLGLGVATNTGGVRDFARNTAQLGIGQAEALASPLQIATAYARLAARGRRIVPWIDRDAGPPPGSLETDPVLAAHAPFLLAAARDVVTSGTAHRVPALDALEAAGKSGTAETGARRGTESGTRRNVLNAWFVGFAPASAPRWVAVVVHEGVVGVHGGTMCGPDVARLLEAALRER